MKDTIIHPPHRNSEFNILSNIYDGDGKIYCIGMTHRLNALLVLGIVWFSLDQVWVQVMVRGHGIAAMFT